jgi:hypothetical protein
MTDQTDAQRANMTDVQWNALTETQKQAARAAHPGYPQPTSPAQPVQPAYPGQPAQPGQTYPSAGVIHPGTGGQPTVQGGYAAGGAPVQPGAVSFNATDPTPNSAGGRNTRQLPNFNPAVAETR